MLKEMAGSGGLTLEVDPDSFKLLARAVDDTRARVEAIADRVHLVDDLPPLSSLESGGKLSRMYNKQAVDLRDVLKGFRKFLNGMLDTIQAAGKAYRADDENSTYTFKRLQNSGALTESRPDSGDGMPEPYINQFGSAWNTFQLSDEQLKLPNGTTAAVDSTAIAENFDPENPSHLAYAQYVTLENYLGGGTVPPPVAAFRAGNDWRWFARELVEKFSDLKWEFDSIGGRWRGAGAESAKRLPENFANLGEDLAARMNDVGNNLLFTSHWLAGTHNVLQEGRTAAVMATNSYTYTAEQVTQIEQETMRRYGARAMEVAYISGLEASSEKIADLTAFLPATSTTVPAGGAGPDRDTAGSGPKYVDESGNPVTVDNDGNVVAPAGTDNPGSEATQQPQPAPPGAPADDGKFGDPDRIRGIPRPDHQGGDGKAGDGGNAGDSGNGSPGSSQLAPPPPLGQQAGLAQALGPALRSETGLDMETDEALWAIARAYPNVPSELVEVARQAFDGQLDGSNAARYQGGAGPAARGDATYPGRRMSELPAWTDAEVAELAAGLRSLDWSWQMAEAEVLTAVLGTSSGSAGCELPELRWPGAEATLILRDLTGAVMFSLVANSRLSEEDELAELYEGGEA
ncbi:hypothetical protein [Nocardia sp. CA-290969]|uniref:hypothetical protein n=1 Tax=Nocardia sp. CA-290969 TaxID=3239986 RepID=UPI003D8E8351